MRPEDLLEEEENMYHAPGEPEPAGPEVGVFHQGPPALDNDYEDLCSGVCAAAIYDYQAEGDDEISFMPDDIITNIEMVDEGWWRGHCHGCHGLFPASYVKLQQ